MSSPPPVVLGKSGGVFGGYDQSVSMSFNGLFMGFGCEGYSGTNTLAILIKNSVLYCQRTKRESIEERENHWKGLKSVPRFGDERRNAGKPPDEPRR